MRIWPKPCTFRGRAVGILVLTGAWLSPGLAYTGDVVDLSRLPDPTRPYSLGVAPVVAPEATAGPELQSTTISPTFRRAVINNRSYKQGDKIDGAVITNIQPYEVTLKQDGRETRIRLLPKLTRQPNISASKPDKDG